MSNLYSFLGIQAVEYLLVEPSQVIPYHNQALVKISNAPQQQRLQALSMKTGVVKADADVASLVCKELLFRNLRRCSYYTD